LQLVLWLVRTNSLFFQKKKKKKKKRKKGEKGRKEKKNTHIFGTENQG